MGTKPRPLPTRLGQKLLRIRKELDLSQEQMAKKLTSRKSPVYPTHISEFERSKREPSLLVLLKYARAAGLSTDVLIDDDLNMPKKLLNNESNISVE